MDSHGHAQCDSNSADISPPPPPPHLCFWEVLFVSLCICMCLCGCLYRCLCLFTLLLFKFCLDFFPFSLCVLFAFSHWPQFTVTISVYCSLMLAYLSNSAACSHCRKDRCNREWLPCFAEGRSDRTSETHHSSHAGWWVEVCQWDEPFWILWNSSSHTSLLQLKRETLLEVWDFYMISLDMPGFDTEWLAVAVVWTCQALAQNGLV